MATYIGTDNPRMPARLQIRGRDCLTARSLGELSMRNEVGYITSKRDGVTRYRFFRAITFSSGNGLNLDRAITFRRDNGSYVPRALMFRNGNFAML